MITIEQLAPIHVVIGRPPDSNTFKGLVEHSFHMDWDDSYVLLFWSGKAYSILGEHILDAKADAEDNHREYVRKKPDWEIRTYNVEDEACPITIDLETWLRWRNAETRGNKFLKRNAPFTMKDL